MLPGLKGRYGPILACVAPFGRHGGPRRPCMHSPRREYVRQVQLNIFNLLCASFGFRASLGDLNDFTCF